MSRLLLLQLVKSLVVSSSAGAEYLPQHNAIININANFTPVPSTANMRHSSLRKGLHPHETRRLLYPAHSPQGRGPPKVPKPAARSTSSHSNNPAAKKPRPKPRNDLSDDVASRAKVQEAKTRSGAKESRESSRVEMLAVEGRSKKKSKSKSDDESSMGASPRIEHPSAMLGYEGQVGARLSINHITMRESAERAAHANGGRPRPTTIPGQHVDKSDPLYRVIRVKDNNPSAVSRANAAAKQPIMRDQIVKTKTGSGVPSKIGKKRVTFSEESISRAEKVNKKRIKEAAERRAEKVTVDKLALAEVERFHENAKERAAKAAQLPKDKAKKAKKEKNEKKKEKKEKKKKDDDEMSDI